MTVAPLDENEAFGRAKLKLAQLRERHQPDRDGRQRAAASLLNRLAEACSAAGLVVRQENASVRVGLWHPQQAEVIVSPSAGGLLVQRGTILSEVSGLHYDPVHCSFVGSDEVGAIELVAAAVISALQQAAERGR